MGLSDAQAFLDPEVGETEQYITAQDIKDSLAQTYTDMPETANVYVGNLLTANQASVETDLTGWSVVIGGGLTRVTSDSRTGLACLQWVVGATGSNFIWTPQGVNGIRVEPSTPYTLAMSVKIVGSGVGADAAIRVWWYKADGSSASVPTQTSASASAPDVWVDRQATFISPPDAAFAAIGLNCNETVLGRTFSVDRIGFWAGAGGEWAMPGTPIVNLGTKVTHPNTDDVLVQKWDTGLGRWQTVHYDSGWRDVSGLLSADALAKVQTWSAVRMRRQGSSVTLQFRATVGTGTAATASTIDVLNPPTGFRFTDYPALGEVQVGSWPVMGLAALTGSSGTSVRVAQANYSAGSVLSVISTWLTNDAIPTSLPGTLVSAAPA